jgi:hypothetical protein
MKRRLTDTQQERQQQQQTQMTLTATEHSTKTVLKLGVAYDIVRTANCEA